MFDIVKLGKNISARRKTLGMTQMELADKLGISYQAVSNWERGQTAPDISKLGEIAEILGCSIDELLGSQRTAEVIKQVEEAVEDPDITPEELADVAPILKPEQVDRTFGSVFSKFGNLGQVISKKVQEAMSGKFSSQINEAIEDKLGMLHEKLDSIDLNDVHVETHDIGRGGMSLTVVANSENEWKEFRELLDITVHNEQSRRELESLARRFSIESVRDKLKEKQVTYSGEFDTHIEDIVDEIGEELVEEREDEYIDRRVERAERKMERNAERAERHAERAAERAERNIERKSERAERRAGRVGRWFETFTSSDEDGDGHPTSTLEALARLAPFLPTETLNQKLRELAEDENSDASVLIAIAPHADDDVVSDVALKLFERSGDLNDVVALAPFMDDDIIDELAIKALDRTDDFAAISGIAPFISDDTLAKLARVRYEKTGEIGSLASIAPFLDSDDLGDIAKQAVRDGKSIGSLSAIAPFLDDDDLGGIARTMVERGEKIDNLAAIAPFMDDDDLYDVAMYSVKNGGSVHELAGIAPFLDEEQLAEIAMNALDSGADFSDLQPIMPFLGGLNEKLWRHAPPVPPTPEKPAKQSNEELIQSLVTLLESSGEAAINPLRNVVDPIVLGEAIRRWEQKK